MANEECPECVQTKCGILQPLMTEDEKSATNVPIQDLSFDFASRIIRLYQYLTQESDNKEYIISKQVFRSGTSIGANLNEARHPQSDADFLSKSLIALKEARETEYWLKLLQANGYISCRAFDSLNKDLDRLIRILIAVTTKVRERLKAEEKQKKIKKEPTNK